MVLWTQREFFKELNKLLFRNTQDVSVARIIFLLHHGLLLFSEAAEESKTLFCSLAIRFGNHLDV